MRHLCTGLWRHADFRRLWAGQTVSLVGSQVTTLALPVAAALTLHATAFQMGILSAAGSLPTLLFGLVVGVGVDRFRRRPLLIGADLGRAVLLGSIPLAALFGLLSMGLLYLVTFLALPRSSRASRHQSQRLRWSSGQLPSGPISGRASKRWHGTPFCALSSSRWRHLTSLPT